MILKYKNKVYRLMFDKYPNGNIKLLMKDANNENNCVEVTRNIEEVKLTDHICIDVVEREGLVDKLKGIGVVDSSIGYFLKGSIKYPICRLILNNM